MIGPLCLRCSAVWDEDFVFLVHVPDSQTLTGVLYDADPIGADRIGK